MRWGGVSSHGGIFGDPQEKSGLLLGGEAEEALAVPEDWIAIEAGTPTSHVSTDACETAESQAEGH